MVQGLRGLTGAGLRWGVLVACGIALTGCGGSRYETIFSPDSAETHYAPSYWPDVQSHYKAYLHGVLGTVWHLKHSDPRGIFHGDASMTHMTGSGLAARLIRSLGTVSTVGTITGVYATDPNKPAIGVTGIGLMKGRGSSGSLCVTFSATSVVGHSDQLFLGKFQVVGGTGRAARLHGAGTFAVLQPNQIKSYDQPFSMELAVAFKQASVAGSRGLSSTCRHATTLSPPPKPKSLKAKFAGWAFASGGAKTHSLPSGATIYPDRARITGAIGCGASNNLYAVIDFSGPKGAVAEGYFQSSFSQTLTQGRNAVFVGAKPQNGTTMTKGEVFATGYNPVELFPTITLSRTC